MVAAVTKSVEHFIVKGEEIALENPEIKNEMLAAVEEVRKTGEESRITGIQYKQNVTKSRYCFVEGYKKSCTGMWAETDRETSQTQGDRPIETGRKANEETKAV